MTNWRRVARVLNPITSLTAEEHSQIKELAAAYKIDWSTEDGDLGARVKNFRAELKDHYYRHQKRRCCYCSAELFHHKATYDAEHILDKAEYREFMFCEDNIAVACKLCNQHKSNKSISKSGLRFVELSRNPDDYTIIHPHIDEWFHHLKFDSVGRIVSQGTEKGRETIRVCGMVALNVTRLADAFDVDEAKAAEEALRTFHEVTDPVRREQALDLLRELAEQSDDPNVDAVIEALTMDLSADEPGGALVAPQDFAVDAIAEDSILVLTRPWVVQTGPRAEVEPPPVLLLPPPAGAGDGESPESGQ